MGPNQLKARGQGAPGAHRVAGTHFSCRCPWVGRVPLRGFSSCQAALSTELPSCPSALLFSHRLDLQAVTPPHCHFPEHCTPLSVPFNSAYTFTAHFANSQFECAVYFFQGYVCVIYVSLLGHRGEGEMWKRHLESQGKIPGSVIDLR